MGRDGLELVTQERRVLKQHGMLGLVCRRAQSKIQDPAKLKRLISNLLNKEQWLILVANLSRAP